MKHLSFLLAFLVLFLSTTSGVVQDKCLSEKQEISNNKQEQKDDCNENCCSPFFGCKTCPGFIVSTFSFPIEKSYLQIEKKSEVVKIILISNYLYSVWHPPKRA